MGCAPFVGLLGFRAPEFSGFGRGFWIFGVSGLWGLGAWGLQGFVSLGRGLVFQSFGVLRIGLGGFRAVGISGSLRALVYCDVWDFRILQFHGFRPSRFELIGFRFVAQRFDLPILRILKEGICLPLGHEEEGRRHPFLQQSVSTAILEFSLSSVLLWLGVALSCDTPLLTMCTPLPNIAGSRLRPKAELVKCMGNYVVWLYQRMHHNAKLSGTGLGGSLLRADGIKGPWDMRPCISLRKVAPVVPLIKGWRGYAKMSEDTVHRQVSTGSLLRPSTCPQYTPKFLVSWSRSYLTVTVHIMIRTSTSRQRPRSTPLPLRTTATPRSCRWRAQLQHRHRGRSSRGTAHGEARNGLCDLIAATRAALLDLRRRCPLPV